MSDPIVVLPTVPDTAWLEEFRQRYVTVRCSAIRWGGNLISTAQYNADVEYLMAHVRPIIVTDPENLRQRHLDLLADVLDAKETMLAAGIERNDFPTMFREYTAKYGPAK